jgi:WhiB family transcriptional regulator, redox-sensing transcriptional regulator
MKYRSAPMFEHEPWMDRARCRGVPVELFFPGRGSAAPALAVCRGCEVAAECGALADRLGEDTGVWGGRDRRRFGRVRL